MELFRKPKNALIPNSYKICNICNAVNPIINKTCIYCNSKPLTIKELSPSILEQARKQLE